MWLPRMPWQPVTSPPSPSNAHDVTWRWRKNVRWLLAGLAAHPWPFSAVSVVNEAFLSTRKRLRIDLHPKLLCGQSTMTQFAYTRRGYVAETHRSLLFRLPSVFVLLLAVLSWSTMILTHWTISTPATRSFLGACSLDCSSIMCFCIMCLLCFDVELFDEREGACIKAIVLVQRSPQI